MYGALRVDVALQIGPPEPDKIHKLSRIHIDIGFSDKLTTNPPTEPLHSLLAHEPPISWRIYPIEYVIAEKLQTLIDRGDANSRAKDVHDLIFLIPQCVDCEKLIAAIENTFRSRQTDLPASFADTAGAIDTTVLSLGWRRVLRPPIAQERHASKVQTSAASLHEVALHATTIGSRRLRRTL